MNDNTRRAGTEKVRTSLTHPLRIDQVEADAAGGRIGITFCPGKQGSSIRGYRWERDLQADLDVIATLQPRAVVTLIEDHEFKDLGVPQLGDQVQARGIQWHHLPIPDVSAPDARFEAAWQTSGPVLLGFLRSGGNVVVHCRGGLGRAGTVAARLLIELGVPAAEAIVRVRQQRRGAIETADQERYVLALKNSQG